MNWETDDKLKKRRSGDKRGAKSDEAYVREVLGDMAKVNNIVVINDEAHLAWRVNPEAKTAKIDRQLIEEATLFVDAAHQCYARLGASLGALPPTATVLGSSS